MYPLIIFLQDSTAQMAPALERSHDIKLPAPPIGGSKNDWIGYGISVGATIIVGLITRAIEKRKMRRNLQKPD